MYKCNDILLQLLSVLHHDKAVSEILLIENGSIEDRPSILSSISEKIKLLPQEQNLYVNPSWNLGVSESSEDYVGILNDDIIVPLNLFTYLNYFDMDNHGVFGACDYLIQEMQLPQRFSVRYVQAATTGDRVWGYGVLMAMKKSHYYPIPEDLLIWAGDDYLFHENRKAGRTNAIIYCPIQTRMSTTSDNKKFNSIKENDSLIYEKKYK